MGKCEPRVYIIFAHTSIFATCHFESPLGQLLDVLQLSISNTSIISYNRNPVEYKAKYQNGKEFSVSDQRKKSSIQKTIKDLSLKF